MRESTEPPPPLAADASLSALQAKLAAHNLCVASVAQQAAEATIPMKATRGRASFLGDRSIGHMDPGACSSALMIQTICQLLEEKS